MTVTRREFLTSLAAISAIPHSSEAFGRYMAGDEPRYHGRTMEEWLQWLADDPTTRPYHEFKIWDLAYFGEPSIPHLLVVSEGDPDADWQAEVGITQLLPNVMSTVLDVFSTRDAGARSRAITALGLWRGMRPTYEPIPEWDAACCLLIDLLKQSDHRARSSQSPTKPLLQPLEIIEVARCLIEQRFEVTYCLGMVAEMLYATDERATSQAAELLAERDIHHPRLTELLVHGIRKGYISPFRIGRTSLFRGEVLPRLVHGIDTADDDEVANILDAVYAVRETPYRRVVIDKLDHPAVEVQRAAMEALISVMPSEESISYLLRGLEDCKEEVQAKAAGQLWTMWRPEIVVEPLLGLLEHERLKVREWAATTLASIGLDAQKAVPALQAMAERYPDESGLAAAVALSRITHTRPDTRLLLSAMIQTNHLCANWAGSALVTCGLDDIPALRWGLSNTTKTRVLCNCLYHLETIGVAACPAIPEILSLFGHADPHVCRTATRTAIAIGKAAVPALRRMATTGHNKSRPRARWALRQIAIEEKTRADGIRRSIEDADPEVRLAAVESISVLGEESDATRNRPGRALRDADIAVRLVAIRALKRTAGKDDRLIRTLQIALSDSNLSVRMRAGSLLQELRGEPT